MIFVRGKKNKVPLMCGRKWIILIKQTRSTTNVMCDLKVRHNNTEGSVLSL